MLATWLSALAIACVPARDDARGPVLLAASSLQEALEEAADAWAGHGHPRPILSFAGTPALARQIEAGAPADILIAADENWMDVLAQKRLIQSEARAVLTGNTLVLIAPASSSIELEIEQRFPLTEALGGGRLAIAEPESVPAGRYAKEALTALGIWDELRDRSTQSENVRAALALVARGEAPLGVVYNSDANAEPKVRVVSHFPNDSHTPITYPIARLRCSTHDDAEAFRAFLLSPEAQAIFTRHGFSPEEVAL